MQQRYARWLLAIMLLTITSLAVTVEAQENVDCGNGLAQRLQVGGTGRVIPVPPVPVNVRDAPGGNRVGQIEPDEHFNVLEGPKCDSSYSWWSVTSDSGVAGWIAEGVDSYFVEPLTAGDVDSSGDNSSVSGGTGGGGVDDVLPLNDDLSVIVDSESCEGDPQFKVGQSVRFTDLTVQPFYGHPLVDKGLFATEIMGPYYENEPVSFSFSYSDLADGIYYVVDGPYCANGEHLVKLGSPGQIQFGSYAYSSAALWFSERDLSAGQSIAYQPAFEKSTYMLQLPPSAQPLDVVKQIGFHVAGGGGDPLDYWSVPDCNLGEWYTAIGPQETLTMLGKPYDMATAPCMEVYPAPAGDVTIRFFQPDGTLYTETLATARTIPITRIIKDDETRTIPTTSVRVDAPDDFGLMVGIWQIEVEAAGFVTRRAYSFFANEAENFQSYCDGPHLKLWINGFDPHHHFDLLYIALADGFSDYIVEEAPFQEISRWPIEVDDHGRLFIDIAFVPSRYSLFKLVVPGADWEPDFSVGGQNPGSLTTYGAKICADPDTPQDIEPNHLVTGLGTFTFTANRNDTVTITSTSFRERFDTLSELDLTLALYAPDGSLLAENDDAANPRFEATDAEITDVMLPESGTYTVVLSAIAGEEGTGGLIVNLERGELATEADVNLNYGEPVTAHLSEQTRWVFAGHAGETVTITIDTGAFDPTLVLRSALGETLAEDDDSGDDLNALIAGYTLAEDGLHIIEITAWNDKTGDYTLSINKQ